MDLKRILKENLIRFGTKNLSEEQKNKLLEFDPNDDGVVTKQGGFGVRKKGTHNRIAGVQRGGFMGGVSYHLTREKDVDLKTVGDILSKMNKDLSDSAGYKKIPAETRNMLAQGFLDALTTLLTKEPIANLERKANRDLKKFFKKSQRWRFIAEDQPNLDIAFKIESERKSTPEELKQAAEALDMTLLGINKANCSGQTIMANQAYGIELIDGTINPKLNNKAPLSTMLPYIDIAFKQIQTGKEEGQSYVQPITLTTPRNTKVFPTGISLFTPAEASKMINSIVNQITKTQFTVNITLPGGKTKSVSESGGDIINRGGKFKINALNVISSASNKWGKPVDFSHDNAGNEVKDFASVDNSGPSGKNKRLAEKRNLALTNAIIAELKQIPWLIVNLDQYDISKEIRITDTEGKTDPEKKDDPAKYPNPGQYAEFEISIGGSIDYEYTKQAKFANKGSFKVLGVTMIYVGRKKTKLTIDAGFAWGGVEKAQDVRVQPIKTLLQNLALRLTHDKDDGEIIKRRLDAPQRFKGPLSKVRANKWQKSIGNKP
jgi:hypothetical protein